MLRNLGVLLIIGLVVYSVLDIVRSDDDERLGAPRVLWVLLVLLVPLFGSIAWIAISQMRRSAAATGGGPSRGPGRPVTRRRGPVAPDDDPDFLRKLDQDRRRREAGPTDEESPQV
ncbi:PLDc N-terminal domain-containing protein [Cellulomonas sp. URHB0016]